MYPTRHRTLALFLAATYPLAAFAADAEPAAEPAAATESAAAAPQAEADNNKREVVVVKASRQNYRALSATGATKTDTLLKDLPQSVRVLTADLLKDVGVTNLASALDLSSGISRQSNLGGLWDSYAMRGFTGDPNFGSDYLVNGFSSSRGYNGLRDSASTASVEVLKGPASALYGRGEPGGTVNITTKKPRFEPNYSIDLSAGSYSTYRGAVDLTGGVTESVAYRLNAAYEKGDSFRDTISTERSFFSPSFIWLIGDSTTLSYEVEASEQRVPFDRGVVAVGGVLGLVPNSRFLGEPKDGPTVVKSLGHQVFLQHEFNDQWKLQSGLSYRDSELKGFSTEANNLLADGRTLRRQRRHRDFSATDVSGRVEVLGKFSTGAVVHNVLVGADAYRFDDRRVQLRRNPNATNPYAIDIYNPVYGGVADPLTLSIDTKESQRAHSFYAQDQVDLTDQWKALLGIRSDSYDQTVTNYRLNVSNTQSLSATSPRLGLVYQPLKTISLYATAAKGFRPNSGISLDNKAFPAEESRSYEVGGKLETADGKITGTLALYKISKENVLTTNPVNTDFSISAGEVGSKGVELDVSGEIFPNVRMAAAYAYTDATVTKGDNTIVTGSRFPNVPKHSGTLVLTPTFKVGTGTATLGGGLNYVGERLGDVAISSNFRLPAYTTAKLISSWSPNKKLRLALNVDNLFNKRYYASSYSQVWVAPGTERTITLNLNYKF
ncbi:TonB-dependent siderophore receptor [Pseudoduganella namucuonensis]|uniref:Iron complex outermembrane recepter protein n=1 Tax=Pseudoduganella namucuonensis TaxID=1035707 RepID=A0A1I7K1R6_9BURK|nr:TonB-dependent siderophore receptor [Pseudoduganella namucuonensis]SFU91339.1 iron complex outermembrane recepter protein [Pseudoduganella namucuonensis]